MTQPVHVCVCVTPSVSIKTHLWIQEKCWAKEEDPDFLQSLCYIYHYRCYACYVKPCPCLSLKTQKEEEDEKEKAPLWKMFPIRQTWRLNKCPRSQRWTILVPSSPLMLHISSACPHWLIGLRLVSSQNWPGLVFQQRWGKEGENWGVRADRSPQIWLLSGPDEHLAGGTSSTKAPESLLVWGAAGWETQCVCHPQWSRPFEHLTMAGC